MDRLRGCSIYDKRATLVNNIPTSDKNILRSNTVYNIVLGKKILLKEIKVYPIHLDIENSIYTITLLQGITTTAVADEQTLR